MNELEKIKIEIEEQRRVLDGLVQSGDMEGVYRQSVKVDRLIEKYLNLHA